MCKKWIRKGTVIGIILLFFGVSVVSSISNNLDLKKTTPSSLSSGLVAYWSFNKGYGNTANDVSGNINDGVIYGANWTIGISGFALEFDGIDDYVEVLDAVSLSPSSDDEITFGAWFKADYIAQPVKIMNKGRDNACIYDITLIGEHDDTGDNRPRGSITTNIWDNNIVTNTFTTNSSGWDDGEWHHVVVVRNKSLSRWEIYIDGFLDIAKKDITTGHFDNNDNMRIGDVIYQDGRPRKFHGIIDEVRIYNRALSGDEIQELYKNPSGLKTKLLIGRIKNLNRFSDPYRFEVIKVLWVDFNPIDIKIYSSDETIIVSNDYFGIIRNKMILGFFNTELIT